MSLLSSSWSNLKLSGTTVADCGPHRVSSRSVSWNCTGNFLANAASDRTARIFAVDASAAAAAAGGGGGAGAASSSSSATGGGGAREVLVIPHSAGVLKTRFSPTEATQLCTAATDKFVRLWDVRNATQRSTGKIELSQGNAPVTVEYGNANNPQNLVVTERDGTVYVYDVRKLSPPPSAAAAAAGVSKSPALYVLPNQKFLPESTVFSPDGNYLLVDSQGRGGGSLIRVYDWKKGSEAPSSLSGAVEHEPVGSWASHGPIYAMGFSPNYKYLATGGSDANVGIWDCSNPASTLVCTHAVARHTKFIRSVAFSHDSRILASSTEEDNVDLADPSNGALIGSASLSSSLSPGQAQQRAGGKSCGAEEIRFHPKDCYLLACARTDSPMGPPPAPLTLIKLSISASSSQ